MSVELQFGDIVDIKITTVDETRKYKIAVCVEPNERWFFLINSKPYPFASNQTMEIIPGYLEKLKYKSYLNLHHIQISDIDAMNNIDKNNISRFSDESLYTTMMYIIEKNSQLNPKQKEKIKKCFENYNGTIMHKNSVNGDWS